MSEPTPTEIEDRLISGVHYGDCDTTSRGGFGDGFPCDCSAEVDMRWLLARVAEARSAT